MIIIASINLARLLSHFRRLISHDNYRTDYFRMELDYSRTEVDYSRTENDFSRISHLEYGISTLDSTLRAFTELWNLAREFCRRILSVTQGFCRRTLWNSVEDGGILVTAPNL